MTGRISSTQKEHFTSFQRVLINLFTLTHRTLMLYLSRYDSTFVFVTHLRVFYDDPDRLHEVLSLDLFTSRVETSFAVFELICSY